MNTQQSNEFCKATVIFGQIIIGECFWSTETGLAMKTKNGDMNCVNVKDGMAYNLREDTIVTPIQTKLYHSPLP